MKQLCNVERPVLGSLPLVCVIQGSLKLKVCVFVLLVAHLQLSLLENTNQWSWEVKVAVSGGILISAILLFRYYLKSS